MIRAAALMLMTLAPAPPAGAFQLVLPLDCVLGQSCFIQQFMDRDPGPGAVDYTCGPLVYDDHEGTDFALPSLAAMQAGVTVLAAAPGRVTGVRDEIADIAANDPAAPPLNGKDCGNGVLIDHGQGWETQYCHMKRGSLRVRVGDVVAVGAPLGQVGLSGRTEFPHLHLSVRKDGARIDPFDPDGAAGCGPGPVAALWAGAVPYEAGGLIAIGFATAVPEFAAIKAGMPEAVVAVDAPALVLWAYFYGNRAGDVLDLIITGPAGEVIADRQVLDRGQAQAFRAAGKRMRAGLVPGQYSGVAVLSRDGAEVDRQVVDVQVGGF